MSGEVIVGGAVGAIVLYLWGWQRVRYVRWYFQRHKRAEEFERSMREAREALTGACPYRKATDADRDLVAKLPDDRALRDSGFTHAGALVLDRLEPRAVGCYLDGAGTTYAMLFGMRSGAAVRLASYSGDRIFATGQRPHGVLAEPPFVTRQMVAAKLSFAEVAARHRTLVGEHALARIDDLDALLARLAANHDRIVAWRAAQPPDDLLDADLKCVLGDDYARYGKPWARRLRGKLPEARLHS